MIIRKRAYPRAGLIGNPSDGYFGKTIAFTFANFSAEVVLYESPELEIVPAPRDKSRFECVRRLVDDVGRLGYYGGIRLLQATIKRFVDHADATGHRLDERNFTIRYTTDIPHLVGLAGSSAIITACMRALMAFYDVAIPHAMLANLVLSVETEELGISAGLQDRVAQAYQGLVYMNFDEAIMSERGHGAYELLDEHALPPLYIAYRTELSEGSDVFHNDMRERFNRRDPRVLDAMRQWASYADQVREALRCGGGGTIGPILDANFDLRAAISRISEGNRAMVRAARAVGASAKFTGSGGAIVGSYTDEAMYARLLDAMGKAGIVVIKPEICSPLKEVVHGS